MKNLLLQKLGLAVLGGALAFSAHGQSTWVEDDFESYFSFGDLEWEGWDSTGDADLLFEDPDGTTNNSILLPPSSTLSHTDQVPTAAPTNDNPVVFSFRFYDNMAEDPESGDLLDLQQAFGTLRDADGFSHFVAVGVWSATQTGTYDHTRYQARVMGTEHNWIQLATERTLGWQEFKIVMFEDSVDIYVNGQVDPNGVAISRASGVNVLDMVQFTGSNAGTIIDDVVVKVDPNEARAFDVTQQPSPLTVAVGDEAVFSVAVADAGVTYRWQKDGVDLFDGSGISGADTDTLTIASAVFEDDAVYRVLISDGSSTQSSAHVPLTVEPFLFVVQPEGVVVEFGESATFTVEVQGEGPFTYEWHKDGAPLAAGGKFTGIDTATLTVNDIQAEDSGMYTVVVENAHGERTSLEAPLSGGPPPTGTRFGDFEEVDAPSPNGSVIFWQPSYSGSSRGLLGTPNTSQVVSEFPAGTWGQRVLRVNFAFDPDFVPDDSPWPWLRLTTHQRNPVIGFDRYFRFEMYSNEDVWVTLGVRESNSTEAYGEQGEYTGDFEYVGGSAEDPGPDRLPQKGVLVTAGSWQTVVFDMPNEFAKPGLVWGDGVLDGAKGILEELAFRPVIAEDGSYASEHEIFLDNFEVTEVEPVIVDPPSDVVPSVAISLGAGTDVDLMISGAASVTYSIQVSTNLSDWTELGTADTDAEGVAGFTDTSATDTHPRRFYRVVEATQAAGS